jgi:hypothetical protein
MADRPESLGGSAATPARNPMTILFKYFWLLAIPVSILNALILWIRSRPKIARDPTLKDGYRKLILGILFWSNLPWAIMGIGCTVGEIPSVFHFFRPRDGNPFVIAFFATVFFEWIILTYWLFARGGAEMIIRHPGLVRDLKSPTQLKLLWCLALLGGIVGVAMLFIMDFPVPSLRP